MHNIGVGIYGEWRYWTTTKSGVIKNYRDWNKNVILNDGLLRFVQGHGGLVGYYTSIRVGDGNSSPVITQSALDNVVYETDHNLTAPDMNYDNPIAPYVTVSKTIPSGTGDLTIREMGVYINDAPHPTLLNRILITDTLGNPDTLVKLDGDTMTIECRIILTRLSETPVESVSISDGLGGTISAKTLVTDSALAYMLSGGIGSILSGLTSVGSSGVDPSHSDTGCNTIIGTAETGNWSSISSDGTSITKSVELSQLLGPSEATFRELAIGTALYSNFAIRTVLSREYVKPLNKKLTLTYKLEFFR